MIPYSLAAQCQAATHPAATQLKRSPSRLNLPRYHLKIAHVMMSTSDIVVLNKVSSLKNKNRESWRHRL